jgi:inosine-uridine nucleoside N-ribohydrolase
MRLAAKHGIEMPLITTSFGNVALDQATSNVVQCRAAACPPDCGPLIVSGAARGLRGDTPLNAEYFHGADGLGGAAVTLIGSALTRELAGRAAPAALAATIDQVETNAHITLLTLGPLTNIAAALRAQPALASRVDELVVLGGCANGRGNITRTAEFNIMCDPEAAALVLAAPWRALTVLPFEVCVAHPLPWAAFDRIFYPSPPAEQQPASAVAELLGRACRAAFVERRGDETAPPPEADDGERRPARVQAASAGAIVCDAVALAYCLRPETVTRSEQVHVAVELDGRLTRGQTVVDFGHASDSASRRRDARWATSIDVQVFSELLEEMVRPDDA